MTTERVTVKLPVEILDLIDRSEDSRSRFIFEAVRREIQRRRRQDLQRSLRRPHCETSELAAAGLDEWAGGTLPSEGRGLVDPGGGSAIRWETGRGWMEPGK